MTTAVSLAQSVAPGVSLGFKNRIINGGMTIDQRNAGATVTPAAGTYIIDRFQFVADANRITSGLSTDAPVGFSSSLVITSNAAYTIGAGSFTAITQVIEANNVSDIAWGASGTQAVTLSFWIKSSLTGTFGGSLRNPGSLGPYYGYPFTYTVNAANTWEYKTVTVSAPNSSLWGSGYSSGNGGGIYVWFDLGTSTAYTATAGSWIAQNVIGVNGTVKLVETNGATLKITGVQLEVGTAATSFEFRDYGRELIMCQRYFQKSYRQSVAAGSSFADVNGDDCVQFSFGTSAASSIAGGYVSFPVEMRASPTLTVYDSSGASGVSTALSAGAGTTNGLGLNVKSASARGIILRIYGASYNGFVLAYKVEAEL